MAWRAMLIGWFVGVGGNLVAVQASRISTSLHRHGRLGELPASVKYTCPNPIQTFCGEGLNARAARVLLLMVVPGHLIFMFMINFLQAGHTTITLRFAAVYLTAAVIQVQPSSSFLSFLFFCIQVFRCLFVGGVAVVAVRWND